VNAEPPVVERAQRDETPGPVSAPEPVEGPAPYVDIPGFCYSASLDEIKAADYALTPGRYVGAPGLEEDAEDVRLKIDRLTKELLEQFAESERLAAVVKEQLGRVNV
jgi:type I restriction enzyme M protein